MTRSLWIAAAAFALPLAAADTNAILIRNVTIHPVTSAAISKGSVLVVDGKIADVGTHVSGHSGAKVVDGHGLHLYPGMINAGTNVGLSEVSAERETVDLDEIGPFNPEIRAEVAFNPSSEHVPVVRGAGITSVISLPASGARGSRNAGAAGVIAGQGALMHLDGWTWEQMAVKPDAVMEMAFPQIQSVPRQLAAILNSPARTFTEEQRRYRETLESVTDFFEQSRRYQKAKAVHAADFRPNIRFDAMIPVLDGKLPLLVLAERERAIRDAVAFADKEKVKIIIADPKEIGSVGALLKEKNIPVILGKSLALPMRDDDSYDSQYALAGEFYKAGVKICFATFDVEFARNLPFEAAQSAAFGLPPEEALKAVTINSAEILGVGDKLGSIEKGKVADLILTDGDPLETRTNVKRLFIAGQEVSLDSRHTREYQKWMARP